VTFAAFHAAGKVFVDKQRVSGFDSDGDIAGAAILSNLGSNAIISGGFMGWDRKQ